MYSLSSIESVDSILVGPLILITTGIARDNGVFREYEVAPSE